MRVKLFSTHKHYIVYKHGSTSIFQHVILNHKYFLFKGNTVSRGRLTVPYALDVWIKGGFPTDKIALGMATYGRSFRLANPRNNGLGAPKSGTSPRGSYTREAGFLSYYEICQWGFTIVRNNVGVYGYKGNDWVGFDDKDSLAQKVSTLIKGNNNHLFAVIIY